MTEKASHGYFPMFVTCAGRIFLVVGGGRVAQRRVQTLLNFDFKIRVVSPGISDELRALADAGRLEWHARPFETGDLDGVFSATACTDSREVNRLVGALCRQRNIPVSVADAPGECDYFFPAVAFGENIVAGIGGNGMDHRKVAQAAARVRNVLSKTDCEAGNDE